MINILKQDISNILNFYNNIVNKQHISIIENCISINEILEYCDKNYFYISLGYLINILVYIVTNNRYKLNLQQPTIIRIPNYNL